MLYVRNIDEDLSYLICLKSMAVEMLPKLGENHNFTVGLIEDEIN